MRGFREKRADALSRFLGRIVKSGPRSALEDLSQNPRLQSALQQLSQGVNEGRITDTVYRRAIQQLGRGFDARGTLVASPNAQLEVAKIPHAYSTNAGQMTLPRQELSSGRQVRSVLREVEGHKAFQDAYLRSPIAQSLIDMPLLGRVDLRTANPVTGQRWSPMYTMQAKDVKGGLPAASNLEGSAQSAARAAAGIEALERQGAGPQHYDAHQGNLGYMRSDGTLRDRPLVFDYGRMGANRFGGVGAAPFSGSPYIRAQGIDLVTAAPGVNASPAQLELSKLPASQQGSFLTKALEAYKDIEKSFGFNQAPAPGAPAAAGRVPTQLNTNGRARAAAVAAAGAPAPNPPNTVDRIALWDRRRDLDNRRMNAYGELKMKADLKRPELYANQVAQYKKDMGEYNRPLAAIGRGLRGLFGMKVEPRPQYPIQFGRSAYPEFPPMASYGSVATGAPPLGNWKGNWEQVANRLGVANPLLPQRVPTAAASNVPPAK